MDDTYRDDRGDLLDDEENAPGYEGSDSGLGDLDDFEIEDEDGLVVFEDEEE